MKKYIISIATILTMLSPFAYGSFFSNLACRVTGETPTPLGNARNLNPQVLNLAMKAYNCALRSGYKDPRQLITVIDYTLPSTQKRLWVIDLRHRQILFNTLVAQGKYTGGLLARYFSDKPESKESSLGLFLTGEPYVGHDGYALRLNGLEPGFNDKAASRDIVMHGAWYVSEAFARRMGRIGLSWGCPAVPKDEITPIVNTIKGGTFLFSYYPNPAWLKESRFLNCKIP